jgi:hypothetical protein
MARLHVAYLLLLLGMMMSACSATTPVMEEKPAMEPVGPTTWAEVEKVEMRNYPDALPRVDDTLVHDVPQSLMNSTADDGSQIEIEGFRIQVFSSSERDEAAVVEDAVERWLSGLSDGQRNALGLPDIIPVYAFYQSPFYRVRVGDFEKREDAARLAAALKRQWAGALVVPDRVTVMR